MEAARAAGCKGIQLVNNSEMDKEKMADLTVDNLCKAIEYIEDLNNSWEAIFNHDE